MRRVLTLFFLTTVMYSTSFAQQMRCGYDDVIESLRKKNPDYDQQRNAWMSKVLRQYRQNMSKRGVVLDTLYLEIPVVFHIVYKTAAENLHDSLCISQLKVINEGFSGGHPDTANIRDQYKYLLDNVNIKFVLASKDPNGHSTTGITHTQTSKTTFGQIMGGDRDEVKYSNSAGVDGWDPNVYMNIWVCNLTDTNFGDYLYGYAYPPDEAPNWSTNTQPHASALSGIVLHYKVVGVNNPLSAGKFLSGKTGVHEVGHYLGLRHTWGDAPTGQNGCFFDDGIDDTPISRNSNSSCGVFLNSCFTNDGLPDMLENFMDYSLDNCTSMFTKEQGAMMRYVLLALRSPLFKAIVVGDTTFDPTAELQFSVYPNPAHNQLTVDYFYAGSENAVLKLVDEVGRDVFEYNLTQGSNVLQMGSVSPGIYFGRLYGSNGKVLDSEKIVMY